MNLHHSKVTSSHHVHK